MQVYAFDLMPWPHLEDASYYPDSNRLYDPRRGRELYEEHLAQMALYEELGYDAVCINEHHAKPYGLMPSPNLIAAALTQRTKRIKIGILGNLPALHAHPVRLAEEIAMLDVMSGGRIISGFVRGVPQEYLALSVPQSEARERLSEAWDLIVEAWTNREPFEWRGKYWRYDRVSIWPRPLQQPHPPIVLPADSDDGLELAARRRVPTGVAYRSLARSRATLDKYRTFAAKHGWRPGPEHCHLLRNVYVAETNQRAREESEAHLEYMFQKLLSYHRGSMKLLGQSPAPRPAEIRAAEDLPFYEFDFELCQKEGISIIGDPEYVTREIQAQMRELDAGVFMGLFQYGSMPHDLAQKNIRLFADKVLPALKRG
ncbi:MAG TPA: LLM class flavin-dependent oxidoreductase [Methylomirabilota bacterium]|jgi:alkanesulfonate monooxygenase SsuD/methylene tetrahydromethanopterin reductase-like flavin-dependent oxidoreductase (luciferase family)|nr:LLM class flavin-dependent oxidoreductase [Methylomirabilota bacterium]